MANTRVLLKKSSVASRVPTTGDLEYGEVALNFADGRLYYKDSSNNIKYFLESSQIPAPILTTNNIDENTATTTTTTANQVIDSFSTTSYRTAKYVLQAINGVDVHSTEILLTHNDNDVYITEYASICSNNSLFNISAQIVGTTLQLIVTPINADTTFDLVKTMLIARNLGID